MKTVLSKQPLRRDFRNHPQAKGLFKEVDLRVTPRSRLFAKVLVFDTQADMRDFWNSAIGRSPICRKTCAVVSGLAMERCKIEKDGSKTNNRVEVDPRYFCVMAFNLDDMVYEVLAHECTHAGFCYMRRLKHRSPFYRHFSDDDEEQVAYPTGRMFWALNKIFTTNGVYDQANARRKPKRN